MQRFAASRARLASIEVPDTHAVIVRKDIEFARPEGNPLLIDLYLPAQADRRPPLVMWLHGGGWALGDRRLCPDLSRWFAADGLAMASIDYRLSGQARFPAPLEDVRTAIRWLRTNGEESGFDADAVGLWGASAGAHLGALAALTATEPEDRVQAIVDGYAPVDMRRLDEGAPPGALIHGGEDSAEARLLGGRPCELDERSAVAASPLAHVAPGSPPFLILHGDADLIVPCRQSELLYEALAGAGCEATLCLIEGVDHGFLDTQELHARPCAGVRVRSSAHGKEMVSDGPPVTFELIRRFFERHLLDDPWSRADD